MVALENIKHRIKNLPGYVKAKVQKKPFHWTMTRKETENRKRGFQTQYNKSRKQQSENRRDKICEELERLGATDLPKYRNTYKQYCISAENANVGEVNVNALNLESENLNLPIKDPLAGAMKSISAAGELINELNQIVEETSALNFVFNQKKIYQRDELSIKEKIEKARELLQEAKTITSSVNKPAARSLMEYIEEMEETIDTLFKEMNKAVEYEIDKARMNLAKAVHKIRQNKNVNAKNALDKLRGSSSKFDLHLLSTYAEALEEQLKRRERQARVARAKSPVQNWSGGKTRRNRKH